jgi:hypothetical protein
LIPVSLFPLTLLFSYYFAGSLTLECSEAGIWEPSHAPGDSCVLSPLFSSDDEVKANRALDAGTKTWRAEFYALPSIVKSDSQTPRKLEEVHELMRYTQPDKVAYLDDMKLFAAPGEPVAPFFYAPYYLLNMTRTVVLDEPKMLRFFVRCTQDYEVRLYV